MKELLEYFIQRTDERFDRLEAKVDRLDKFKIKVTAYVVSAGVVVQALLSCGSKILGGH